MTTEKMRMELTFSKSDSDLWQFINDGDQSKGIIVKKALRHYVECTVDIDSKIAYAVEKALENKVSNKNDDIQIPMINNSSIDFGGMKL